MPELPEIAIFARDMHKELAGPPGATIASIEVLQPKCLNLPEEEFNAALVGAQILGVAYHGKWLKVETSQGWLLLNLGMGGEILLTDRSHLPEKYRLIFDQDGGTCLAVNFWWFGYCHYAVDPSQHPMVGTLGPNALDLSLDESRGLLKGRRGAIKTFLLDQKRIAGIGNVYVQTPLWRARIHPLRPIPTLTEDEIAALWQALQDVLRRSIDAGGAPFELNLYGQKGGWDDPYLFHWEEGAPCPACGTPLAKIRTVSTGSYICPGCQRL
jgi:formamidopyrimidine-DNA glycosylase